MFYKPHLVFAGDRFGKLKVVDFHHNDKRHRRHYTVVCDCGTVKTVQGTLLRTGNTKSCGCGFAERGELRRLPNNHSEVTAIILGYRRHAIGRGYSWNLTRSDVESIILRPCFYCGDLPRNIKKHKNTVRPLIYNGIDRKDNKQGYTLENTVPCCRICNHAKGTLTVEEFSKWAKRIGAMADQWGCLGPLA